MTKFIDQVVARVIIYGALVYFGWQIVVGG